MMKLQLLIFLCALFALPGRAHGQETKSRFHSSLLVGLNASQLDGDNLSGFNKLGIHTGMRMAYWFSKNAVSLELLWHQKGSTESLSFGTPDELQSITLNYVSMPLMYHLNEWYDMEFKNHRIRIDAGLVTNALFAVSSTNPAFDDNTDDFKRFDFGLAAGVGYRLGYRWLATFRYERSVLKIYRDALSGTTGLQSYLLTFRLEYEL